MAPALSSTVLHAVCEDEYWPEWIIIAIIVLVRGNDQVSLSEILEKPLYVYMNANLDL